MFKAISSEYNPAFLEEQILNFWKLHRVTARAEEWRAEAARFIAYDLPASAHRPPASGQISECAAQDFFQRYKRMRGYRPVRRAGWRAHGLDVEWQVEQQFKLAHKQQVENLGTARFNEACQGAAFQHLADWERFNNRLGVWVDMQEAYLTHTPEYCESLWWAFKTLWERGQIQQVRQVAPYCARCGSMLSEKEALSHQRLASSPTASVRLPLVDEPEVSLLAWSAMPWTLPASVAVAVHPEAEYVTVRRGLLEGGSERLILAADRLEAIFGEERVAIIDRFSGRKLKDRRYRPLFTFLQSDQRIHYVIQATSPVAAQGSGLVPVTPAYNQDHLRSALEVGLPVWDVLSEDGLFIPEVRPWSGLPAQEAQNFILQELEARGLLLHTHLQEQAEALCPYCSTPLVHRARDVWRLHLEREGEGPGWALNRRRYWAAPLPIWECGQCRLQMVVGSLTELERLSGRQLSSLDLHRPAIDEIIFPCPKCNPPGVMDKMMRRIPDVLDAAFDAACLPLAQWHFPFENRESFRENFPADLACASQSQSIWLEQMQALSNLLVGNHAYQNASILPDAVFSTTQADIWELIQQQGADTLRWQALAATEPGAHETPPTSLGEKVWRISNFLATCAQRDHWQPGKTENPYSVNSTVMDHWLVSELHSLAHEATQALDAYQSGVYTSLVETYVDSLLDWYLVQERRRFWKDSDVSSRWAAYQALQHVLTGLSRLIAPAMPFLAEVIHQNLIRPTQPSAPISVHLCDWPAWDEKLIEPALSQGMRKVRSLVKLGAQARQQSGLKISQPLALATINLSLAHELRLLEHLSPVLARALNVQEVQLLHQTSDARDEMPAWMAVADQESDRLALDAGLTPLLQRAGLAGETIHCIEGLRRQASIGLAEQVRLYITGTPTLLRAIQENIATVLEEAWAEEWLVSAPPAGLLQQQAWFGGEWAHIGIEKTHPQV